MAVAPVVTETVYQLAGAGVGPFATIWPYNLAGDVSVFLDTGAGAVELFTPGDYALAPTLPTLASGGGVTLSASLQTAGVWPAGTLLTLVRATPNGQPSTFGEAGVFSPEASEAALDNVERQVQELSARAARALSLPYGESAPIFPDAAARVGKVLGSTAMGAPLWISPGFTVNVSALDFPSAAAAAATVIAGAPGFLRTAGFSAAGDGGHALYSRSIGPAAAGKFQSADGAWWKLAEQVGNIRMFGALIDGASADTTAWNAALAWADATGRALYHPGGNSIFVGNMQLRNQTIIGVDSYKDIPGLPISQTSLITFKNANGGITLATATSGGFTLEKIGLRGIPGTYANQVGIFMDDALRPGGQNEGWPTLRDVSIGGFNVGMNVGEKYQGGWMWNVYFLDSVNIGYWNQSVDWYHYMVTCGSNLVVANWQLLLGPSAPSAYSAGSHQFVGGAFFGAVNTVGIQNCFGCQLTAPIIQNARDTGLVIGDGVNGVSGHIINGAIFSGNNQGGGVRNVNGHNSFDIWLHNNAQEIGIYNCMFAEVGTNGACVSAGVRFEGPNNAGSMIQNSRFNMDQIVTPGAPAAPIAVWIQGALLLNGLDHNLVTDCMAFYGEAGIYPAEQRSVDMVSIANPYALAGTLSIKAGSGFISAAVAMFLENPKYAGRPLLLSGVNGAAFTAATAGGLGAGHSTCTFAAGGWIQLLSTGPTTWQVCGSANVVLT